MIQNGTGAGTENAGRGVSARVTGGGGGEELERRCHRRVDSDILRMCVRGKQVKGD